MSNQLFMSVMDKIAQPAMERPMKEKRFWGSYIVLDYINLSDRETELSKRLHIDAGKGISYQRHAHRDEIWTIADGEGYFVMNGEVERVGRGDVLVIKAGNLHAIRAIKPLIIIEVQLGFPLIEEDIERFELDWNSILQAEIDESGGIGYTDSAFPYHEENYSW